MTLVRSDVEATDPEVVQTLLSGAYADGLTLSRSGRAAFSFRQSTASDGAVTVSSLQFSGRVTAAMSGSREIIFTDIARGRYSWRSKGRRGDQARPLILPSGHELTVELDAVTSTMVSIAPRTFTRHLMSHHSGAQAQALLRQAIAGPEPVRHALRLFGHVMPSESFESDLVRANLLDLLLTVTAEHLLGERVRDAGRIAPAALRRAEEFLRAHAADPVSIADAAAAAGLSVRGLQDQFIRWRQMTPSRYLRNLRLAGARADLISARDEGRREGVGEVARRWGFAHLGRFSSYYADAFGEAPSRTLRASGEYGRSTDDR